MRAFAIALAVALAACGGGGGSSVPDGARVPDVEGVVVAVDERTLVLDRDRTLALDPDVASVSTYTLEPVPLRVGTYVHAGLNGDDRVQWVATIGIVADTNPPAVRYTGTLREVDGGRAVFDDGTALRVTDDLPLAAGFLNVELDPVTGRIRRASTT